MEPRISFRNVTIDYPIFDVKARSLKRHLVMSKVTGLVSRLNLAVGGNLQQDSSGTVIVRALDSINFSLFDGDRLALLGHNGAGKSTLLKVAAGIYEPPVGEVISRGRVMPLFNIMEGMQPDANGVEMMRVRGALLGLTENQIREKIDEIIDFCELGDYINVPVRTYSTGMLVRLAFAITTAVPSDILIMDEIIGAGDASFFKRAEERLKRFVDQARVLIIATHSPETARQWCNKAILLEHGRMLEFGPVDEVISAYARLRETQHS